MNGQHMRHCTAALVFALHAVACVGCTSPAALPPPEPAPPTEPPLPYVPPPLPGGMHGDPERWILVPFRISYPAGGSSLDDDARAALRELRDTLARRTDITHIRVEGHADDGGNAEANRRLGRERARVVVDFLVDEVGMDRALFEIESRGDLYQVPCDTTPTHCVPNDRVEVSVDVERPSRADQ